MLSMIRYPAILLIDSLWIYVFFNAYTQGREVSGFFFLFMFAAWYVFNMFCVFLEDRENQEKEDEKETLRQQDLFIMRILNFIVFKIKYLAIISINLASIGLMIRSYLKNGDFPWLALLFLLIYDLFNFFLIEKTSNIKVKEFYRFLLIVCPPIIISIWFFVA